MRKFILPLVLLVLAIAIAGCSDGRRAPTSYSDAEPKFEPLSRTGNDPYREMGKVYVPLHTAEGFEQRGIASWYGKAFHGKRTSNGEKYDMYKMTAAHKILPLPSYVSVTNVSNKKTIIVRVNDRGPFVDDRIIDLSFAAASELDLVGPGTGEVKVKAIVPKGGRFARKENREVFIQAGAFSVKENAVNLKRRLKEYGFDDVDVQKKRKSGSTIYLVRIGPVNIDKNFDQLFNRIASRISGNPVVVSK